MRWSGPVWRDIERFVYDHLFLRRGTESADELVGALWSLNRGSGGNRAKLSPLSDPWRTRWMPDSRKFDEWYGAHWMPLRVTEISALCARRGKSLLDLGCGDGRLTAAVAQAWSISANNCVGLDVGAVGHGASSPYFERVLADIERDDLRARVGCRRFDLILGMQVFHHLQNPRKAMKKAHGFLSADGLMLVRDHDATTIYDRLFLKFVDDFFFYVVHAGRGPLFARYHSIGEWSELLMSSGFSIAKVGAQGANSLFRQFDIVATPRHG